MALENKLGITESAELARAEERIFDTKKRIEVSGGLESGR